MPKPDKRNKEAQVNRKVLWGQQIHMAGAKNRQRMRAGEEARDAHRSHQSQVSWSSQKFIQSFNIYLPSSYDAQALCKPMVLRGPFHSSNFGGTLEFLLSWTIPINCVIN
jgi:hypothetical protein